MIWRRADGRPQFPQPSGIECPDPVPGEREATLFRRGDEHRGEDQPTQPQPCDPAGVAILDPGGHVAQEMTQRAGVVSETFRPGRGALVVAG